MQLKYESRVSKDGNPYVLFYVEVNGMRIPMQPATADYNARKIIEQLLIAEYDKH